MRSLTTTAWVLSVGLSLVAQTGFAQSPSQFRELPPIGTPWGSSTQPAGYNDPTDYSMIANSFGSSFVTQSPSAPAMQGPPATGMMVGPPQGSPNQPYIDPTHSWDNFDTCDGCSACNSCLTCGGCRWFGAVGGLIMGRNRPNGFWTTYETNNNPNQLVNTQHAGANWGGGAEVTVGYNFCECGPGIALTYWGVTGMDGFYRLQDPAFLLSTPIDLGFVDIGGNPTADYFDNAFEHSITRRDSVNNVEINLVQSNFVNQGRLQMIALAGFRYFQFNEFLGFQSIAGVPNPTDADTINLDVNTTNNLYGGQVGAIFNYMATDRLSLFVTSKVGIFSNQMTTRVHLFLEDGTEGFDIPASKNDVSMMGELDFGFNYAITQNWRAYLGYRIVAVTDLALADNQFLPFLADSAGFAQVKQNGDLILHGVMMGLAWNY